MVVRSLQCKKRTARDIRFQLFAYQRLVSMVFVAGVTNLRESKEKILQAPKKAAETGGVLWGTRNLVIEDACGCNSFSVQEKERDESDIVVGKLSFFPERGACCSGLLC